MNELPTDRALSCPLFLKAQRAYTDSHRRVMIVGQQTQLWPPHSQYGAPLGSDPVKRLMDEYVEFNFGADRSGTPFWRATHIFREAVNDGAPRSALLWSNLVKLDEGGTEPSDEFESFINRFDLLRSEVRLCRPDVVLFLSGKRYDHRLIATFDGARITAVQTHIATVTHPDLPSATYRIPHPKWLQLRNLWHVVDTLVDTLRGA